METILTVPDGEVQRLRDFHEDGIFELWVQLQLTPIPSWVITRPDNPEFIEWDQTYPGKLLRVLCSAPL
jgi:hypothetical protein